MKAARIALVLVALLHATAGAPMDDSEHWLNAYFGDAGDAVEPHLFTHNLHTADQHQQLQPELDSDLSADGGEDDDDGEVGGGGSDTPEAKRRRLAGTLRN